jgi:hypothetical protein
LLVATMRRLSEDMSLNHSSQHSVDSWRSLGLEDVFQSPKGRKKHTPRDFSIQMSSLTSTGDGDWTEPSHDTLSASQHLICDEQTFKVDQSRQDMHTSHAFSYAIHQPLSRASSIDDLLEIISLSDVDSCDSHLERSLRRSHRRSHSSPQHRSRDKSQPPNRRNADKSGHASQSRSLRSMREPRSRADVNDIKANDTTKVERREIDATSRTRETRESHNLSITSCGGERSHNEKSRGRSRSRSRMPDLPSHVITPRDKSKSKRSNSTSRSTRSASCSRSLAASSAVRSQSSRARESKATDVSCGERSRNEKNSVRSRSHSMQPDLPSHVITPRDKSKSRRSNSTSRSTRSASCSRNIASSRDVRSHSSRARESKAIDRRDDTNRPATVHSDDKRSTGDTGPTLGHTRQCGSQSTSQRRIQMRGTTTSERNISSDGRVRTCKVSSVATGLSISRRISRLSAKQAVDPDASHSQCSSTKGSTLSGDSEGSQVSLSSTTSECSRSRQGRSKTSQSFKAQLVDCNLRAVPANIRKILHKAGITDDQIDLLQRKGLLVY